MVDAVVRTPKRPRAASPPPPASPPVSSLRLRHRIPTVGCALLMGALMVLTVFGEDGLIHRHLRVRELERYEAEMRLLEEESFQLRLHIQRLRDRPLALERAAASDLLMARPDAVIYHFPPGDDAVAPQAPASPGIPIAMAGYETAPEGGTPGAGRRIP